MNISTTIHTGYDTLHSTTLLFSFFSSSTAPHIHRHASPSSPPPCTTQACSPHLVLRSTFHIHSLTHAPSHSTT
ncbi:uncharacterized protein BO80DRAFT_57373 [Aspergillus ibericus CBS 121593]|uniref:Uncharacterized protein n=1 Tax=Aspergillus ibericus CBS 121593 TaxID=1448316 RepID=A0A395H3K4_9EURO|nr:hypothetical protein BO80DRAFT_57373 [Aspergillus ibericus CBS 121593]RAL01785.1 hypothetical protein BO80DRAFT_57373 [Aspergillus ibericus CBS 121593]